MCFGERKGPARWTLKWKGKPSYSAPHPPAMPVCSCRRWQSARSQRGLLNLKETESQSVRYEASCFVWKTLSQLAKKQLSGSPRGRHGLSQEKLHLQSRDEGVTAVERRQTATRRRNGKQSDNELRSNPDSDTATRQTFSPDIEENPWRLRGVFCLLVCFSDGIGRYMVSLMTSVWFSFKVNT